jgi:hypothetical protein
VRCRLPGGNHHARSRSLADDRQDGRGAHLAGDRLSGKREFRILPRKTMHAWTGAPVDLDDLRGRPLDAETLRLATDRIMAALTGLLEQIRGEPAPAVRFDRRRINEQKFDPDEGES